MICKDRNPDEHEDSGKFAAAGAKAEEQMAFYLRRAFKDRDDVLVFNDLRVEIDTDDPVQIDHLVLYSGGLVIIESKSCHGEMRVNEKAEFSRTWNSKPQGMKSPVAQAKLQMQGLLKLLDKHAEDLQRKVLGVQGRFGACEQSVIVAVSEKAIIEREVEIPELVKAEHAVDHIKAILKKSKPFGVAVFEVFNAETRAKIKDFLLERHKPLRQRGAKAQKPAPQPEAVKSTAPSRQASSNSSVDVRLECVECRSRDTLVLYKHSYYVKCKSCGKNTKPPLSCASCGKRARLRKSKQEFFRECSACGLSERVHVNP